MNDNPEFPPVARTAYMQTAHLVELLLDNDRDQVRDLVAAMPAEQIMPLLGSALIFGAEAMKDNFGVDGALEQIGLLRQQVGMRGGVEHG